MKTGIIETGHDGTLLLLLSGRKIEEEGISLHASPESAAEAVREKGAQAVRLVLSKGRCLFRRALLPPLKKPQLIEALPFELEPDLPFALDAALFSPPRFEKREEGVEGSAVIAFRPEIEEITTVIESRGMSVLSVDWAPALAASAFLAQDSGKDRKKEREESFFLADPVRRWMACVVKGRVVEIHPFSSSPVDLRREMNLARLALPENIFPVNHPPRLVVIGSERDDLVSTGTAVAAECWDPFAFLFGLKGEPNAVLTEEFKSCGSGAAAALYYEQAGGAPYRLIDKRTARAEERMDRRMAVAASVMAALLILFLGGAWYTAVSREAARMEALTEERDILFSENFSGTPVKPVAQARWSVEDLRQKNARMEEVLSRERSALAMLNAVSRAIPSDASVELIEFTARPESISFIVRAQGYAAADQILPGLEETDLFTQAKIDRQASVGRNQVQMEFSAAVASSGEARP